VQSDLVWHRGGASTGRILVDADALTTLQKYRQDSADKPEAGGILIGYRRDEHLHITYATEPSEEDIRSRYSFERVAKTHQSTATEQWNRSGGKTDYLGEWHSHPEVYPSPSRIDRSEWRLICQRRALPMVFIIIGMSGNFWLGCSIAKQVERCSSVDTG
jgi:hypothetical protein